MQTDTTPVVIEKVSPEQVISVMNLLAHSGLPLDGLDVHLANTLVARRGASVIGSAALELYGEAALLRSVAVDETLRGQGIGQRLVAAALGLARAQGVRRVYLLTESAAAFFARLGFRPITRTEVTPAVQQSVEFISVCPQSAQAMVLEVPV